MASAIKESDGKDSVVIYIKDTKQRKVLPNNQTVLADDEFVSKLGGLFGEENIKVTY